jgi:hypothetical protein
MKEPAPHPAEKHGLAPGPGKASNLWTFFGFWKGGKDSCPGQFSISFPEQIAHLTVNDPGQPAHLQGSE